MVSLRLVPAEPTYACVVDGSGKQLFGGTLSEPQSFRAKRIRINLGRTSVASRSTRSALRIPPSSNPIGYDLRAGRKPRRAAARARPELLMPRAGIVVTGTEVLTGRVQDRNGPWLADRLLELGIELAHITICGDRPRGHARRSSRSWPARAST